MKFVCNPLSRILETKEFIELRNLEAKVSHRVDHQTLLILLCFKKPVTVETAFDDYKNVEFGYSDFNTVVNKLRATGHLVSKNQCITPFSNLSNFPYLMSKGQFPEASYIAATTNFPGFDYSTPAGYYNDTERMKRYVNDHPDDDRSLLLDSIEYFPLQGFDQAYEALCAESFHDLTKNFSNVLSFCFGVSHEIPYTNRDGAPKLRKIYPTGGGRHPTEIFFTLNTQMGDVDSGSYHLGGSPLGLGKLHYPQKISNDSKAFLKFEFFSKFERNWYRYREPRTFRTVFMDAGHAAYSVAYILSRFGCTSSVSIGGVSYLEEEGLPFSQFKTRRLLSVEIN